ncbi:hypothetical protein BGW80DRAFT_1300343 [Lactifluus volemus]|nr:hypothetical protein BGW80DRAFT_1300343 [Lactifluus volemus]
MAVLVLVLVQVIVLVMNVTCLMQAFLGFILDQLSSYLFFFILCDFSGRNNNSPGTYCRRMRRSTKIKCARRVRSSRGSGHKCIACVPSADGRMVLELTWRKSELRIC